MSTDEKCFSSLQCLVNEECFCRAAKLLEFCCLIFWDSPVSVGLDVYCHLYSLNKGTFELRHFKSTV